MSFISIFCSFFIYLDHPLFFFLVCFFCGNTEREYQWAAQHLHRLSKHSHNVRPAGPCMFFMFFFGFSDKSLFDFVGCSEKAWDSPSHGCWDGTTCCFQTHASCRGCCGCYVTLILRLEGQSKSITFFVFCYFFFSPMLSSIQIKWKVEWAMWLWYNAALLPPPISHTPHTPNISFGANIIPERVDKHPSTNTNRPEFSRWIWRISALKRVDEVERNHAWNFTYAPCSCSNVTNSLLSLNPCWSLPSSYPCHCIYFLWTIEIIIYVVLQFYEHGEIAPSPKIKLGNQDI